MSFYGFFLSPAGVRQKEKALRARVKRFTLQIAPKGRFEYWGNIFYKIMDFECGFAFHLSVKVIAITEHGSKF